MNKLIKKIVALSMLIVATGMTGNVGNKARIVYGEEADFYFEVRSSDPKNIYANRNYELNNLGFSTSSDTEAIFTPDLTAYESYIMKLTTNIARFSAGDIAQMKIIISNSYEQYASILSVKLGNYEVFYGEVPYSFLAEITINFSDVPSEIISQPLIIEIFDENNYGFYLKSIAIYGAADQLAMATDAKVREFYNSVCSADHSIIKDNEIQSLKSAYDALTIDQRLLMNQARFQPNNTDYGQTGIYGIIAGNCSK